MQCNWFRARLLAISLATVGVFALGGQAKAQIAADFPSYKGSSARTGHNGTPSTAGSGATNLRWYVEGAATEYVGDNYPYTSGSVITNSFVGTWGSPTLAQEARDPYLIRDPADLATIFRPSYRYTSTTASAEGTDPTIAATPADRRYFQWTYNTSGATRDYALYVWIPSGPTTLPSGSSVYPQQRFVYEVLLNGSRVLVDTVDTAQGGAWVRLGSSGTSTPFVVRATSSQPITIRLYNTVPRNSNGTLILPSGGTATGYAVYADAVKFVASGEAGSYTAAPVVTTFTQRDATQTRRVIAVRNNIVQGLVGTDSVLYQKAVATSYLYNGSAAAAPPYNVITPFWTYSPLDSSASATNVDNSSATVTGTGFASSTLTGRYTGTDYQAATLLVDPSAATGDVQYKPTLADGDYEIWAYMSGDTSAQKFGHSVDYEIREGTTLTHAFVDQSTGGWVRIGTTRFTNTADAPLDVRVTNHSDLASDTTLFAYADAIRFVGASDLSVTSTPIQATARIKKSSGTVEDTPVVVIADERGVLHCLDAEGNSDGTTTEYWSYPSTRDSSDADWVDPNVKEGIDGKYSSTGKPEDQVVTAIMPTGFDLSSALIQRIDGEDYLYIASKNGRVYCIAMQGRGDYNQGKSGAIVNHAGSTKRAWTYPTDPIDNSRLGIEKSALGAFVGSVVYGKTADGPTLFVPAPQGRIYALDATPNLSGRTTSVRWAYPLTTAPALGAIESTPSLEFGNLYVGTMRNGEAAGQLLAITADTGALLWNYTPVANSTALSDFRCSPVTASRTAIGDTKDYVFALNDNGYMYAVQADTGDTLWTSNERSMASRTTLGFTYVTSTANNIVTTAPVVTVAGTDGRMIALLAKDTQTTKYGTRYVMSRTSFSNDETTPFAFADGWMFNGDAGGNLYARANANDAGSVLDPADPRGPADGTQGDEDTKNLPMSKAKVRLITRDAFRSLQLAAGTKMDYKTALASASGLNRSPLAFDWGETAYVLLYDFPYPTSGAALPSFSLDLTVDGKSTGAIPATTLQFDQKGAQNPPKFNDIADLTVTSSDNPLLDGYAVAQVTFQSAGPHALPPGKGRIEINVTSIPTIAGSTASQQIDMPPNSGIDFYVANPIGLIIPAQLLGGSNSLSGADSIGSSLSPSDSENLINGSQDVGTSHKSRLSATTGKIGDGESGSTTIGIVDRSLMSLLRPGGVGLDNIRVQLRDIAWQGGEAAILRALDSTLYPDFEDKPSSFPNTSKDYPNIARDQVRVTKDPQGNAENPVSYRSSLNPPYVGTASNKQPITEDNAGSRILDPTPFQFTVDVPRYQPPNTFEQADRAGASVSNSTGVKLQQGYQGRISVFVDSQENGVLDTVSTKEAFRSFNLLASVAPAERLTIVTPNVDLGSVAGGTGYSPLWPASGGPLDPWSGAWSSLYKSFTVRNEGNVNLLDVRVATKENISTSGGTYNSVPFYSDTVDSLGWLDASLNLHSDLNAPFAPTNPNYDTGAVAKRTAVIVPKPRVEDRVGTDVSVNPLRRANPNLGTTGFKTDGSLDSLLDPAAYPPGPPRIAVSVPLGFPAGHYVQSVAVVENYREDYLSGNKGYDLQEPAWSLWPEGPGPVTDPGLVMSFTVRESRVTGSPTPRVAPMVEDLEPTTTQQTSQLALFPYSNLQPAALRDPSGGLLVAWTSNRPQYSPSVQIPSTASTGDAWKIFLASVGNSSTFGNSTYTGAGQSPISDLNNFSPDTTNGRWFKQVGPSTGYPTDPALTLFGSSSGAVEGTQRFGSPSFPVSGSINPYRSSSDPARLMGNTFMAFLGDVQTNSTSGRGTLSRVFIAPVSTSSGGAVSLGSPVPLASDSDTAKSKPSVVVAADTSGTVTGAVVFYSGTSAGSTGLYYAYYNGSQFDTAVPLNLGGSFESVSSPSGAGRAYVGVSSAYYGNRIIDLTFTGKLRNRPMSEIFMGRMKVGDNGAPVTGDPFVYLPAQTDERLTVAGNATYRARGVDWNRLVPIRLLQVRAGVARSLLMDGYDGTGVYNPTAQNPDTRVIDRESGMLVYTSRTGGKVYVDPGQGTIRFASSAPAGDGDLFLTYQAKFLRVSPEGSGPGYSNPTALYDQRYISTPAFWRTSSGADVTTSNTLTNDRYVFTFNRAASSADSTNRPYVATYRLGIRLPTKLGTDADGNVTPVQVSGSSGSVGSFQVDPANQSIYFTSFDEDREVTVQYTDVNGVVDTYTGVVGLVPEFSAYQIPLDQTSTESNLTAFLDPFTYASAGYRRPPLIWLFWASTRAGAPDVFFQTIAPNWTPVVSKQ